MDTAAHRSRFWIALGAVLLAGFVLRVVGIGWGLPGQTRPDEPPFHPDEEVIYEQAGKLYTDSNPLTVWGGALYIRSAWAVRKVVEGLGKRDRPTSFRRTLLGLRWLNVLYSMLAALLLAWAGYRLLGPTGGFLAAGFLLLSPAHVMDSHFARPDVLLTLFVAGAAAAAVKAVTSRDRRFVLLGAVSGGLAASTMIWGVVTMLPLLIAWIEATPPERGRFRPASLAGGGLTLAAGALAGYLLGSFETVLYWDAFRVRWLQGTVAHRGAFGFPLEYLGPLAAYAFGILTVLGACGGVLLALLRRRPARLALASSLLVAIAVLGSQHGYMQRYVLWLLPFVALLAATFFRGRILAPAGVVALFFVLYTSASLAARMEGPDPRYEVARAIRAVGGDSDIGCVASFRGDRTYTPRLPADTGATLLELRLFEAFDPEEAIAAAPKYFVITDYSRNHFRSGPANRLFDLLDRGGTYHRVRSLSRGGPSGWRLERILFPRAPEDLLYVELEFEVYERR